MSRKCLVTGRGVLSGNNVSHSNRKVRRRFLPNLHNFSLMSEVLGRKVKLKGVSIKGLRIIERKIGLDNFLLNTDGTKLTKQLKKLKERVANKLDGTTTINKYLNSEQ